MELLFRTSISQRSVKKECLRSARSPRFISHRGEVGYAAVHRRGKFMGTPSIRINVNGKARAATVEPRLLLVHFLREQLRLPGTHIGCDTSQSGGCTELLGGPRHK